MKRLCSIIILCLVTNIVRSQTAASYTFSQSNGTFTHITGTTIYSTWDDNTTSGLPIGFTFNFCGTNYTTFNISANGWIGFASVSYFYDPLSSGTKLISGFGNDLYYNGPGHGPLVYAVSGNAPNRVLTIQWDNFCHYSSSTTGPLNMQIKLHETTNIIDVVYGDFLPSTSTTYTTNKVGIKGNISSDYNTRTTTSNWSATTAGTNTSSCWQSNTIKPSSGLTFSWCPQAPAIGGTTTTCVGSTTTLTDASPGGTWSSSNTGVATVGSSTGVVTGISAGTATITYTPACGAATTVGVTISAAPPAIGGSSNVCTGATTTLTHATSGGTWTSSNTGVATVGGGTGVVSGITSGTATITYTLPSGCIVTKPFTVNGAPGAITGTTNVCVGQTTTLSDPTTGGTWSSSNVALATVGSSSGIVTGVASGTPTITYTATTGCSVTAAVVVNPLPSAITGTTTVCATQTTTLNSSTSGGTWTVDNPALATADPATGIVTGVSSGTPVVSYTLPTGCFVTQQVTVNALSLITGTPSMCLGLTTTLSDATPGGTWSSSNPSVATITGGGMVTGISLGTATISYNISTTGCTATQTVAVTNPPASFSLTGGGTYCDGGTGVSVGLSGSEPGVTYQLYNYSTPVGAAMSGTGFLLSFGLQTAAGPYGVIANPGTGCATSMTGTATVNVNPLPVAYTVSGGGSYCAGGSGVHIFLNSSSIGINYQLYNGASPVGSPVPGTSSVIDFGMFTATGTYTIWGTNATTGCTTNMAGSATISTIAAPTLFNVTGGGGYCSGGTGVHVGLSGSESGVNYQLFYAGFPSGAALPGTGAALDFGLETSSGTYTVVATNTATGCVSNMSGSVAVVINSLPTVFTVTGGGAYCSGGTGIAVGLNGSSIGVNYQLYKDGISSGPAVAGTGVTISFGLETLAGNYTVIATNATTGCVSNMSGSAVVSINPLPSVFSITGGGGYCAGGTGVHIGLTGSVAGTTYQLFNGTALMGAASGTGGSLDFGLKTVPGTYTVTATITATGCTANMSGSVSIVVNPLPTSTFLVTGGGSYCSGGAGVTVGLSGSQPGISYQLFADGAPSGSPVSGTGGAISFGLRTATGTYTVVGTNLLTTCRSNMTGSVVIGTYPLPVVYSVTGGGSFCSGGSGVSVGLSSSTSGTNYQLYNGVTAVGSPITALGFPLDFGLQTAAGTYTIRATNPSTSCTNTMSGSAVISIDPVPAAFTVTGGGSYCTGGAGMHIGLSNSVAGINYQLNTGGSPVGTPLPGTGAALDFGLITTPGIYSATATNATTGCTNNMSGSATINVDPLPTIFSVTGGGTFCSGGTGVHVGVNASSTGISYQLYNGFAVVGTPIAGTGAAIDFGLQTATGVYTVVATNTTSLCTINMSGSATVLTNPLPALFTVSGGGSYCAGGTGVHVHLNGSSVSCSYQLFVGIVPSGSPVSGTGTALDFGLRTTAGNYTVVATDLTTGCTQSMTGSVAISIDALPVVYTVFGGGSYCPGGAGFHVGISGTEAGVNYQLYNGASPVGGPVAGTGAPFDFGLMTAPGNYVVIAKNPVTTCTRAMAGSATISIYSLPSVYTVTGGGSYCSGDPGVHVGLSNSSSGVSYQLFRDGVMTGGPITGTGFALDFGLQTPAGAYTITATGIISGCTSNMGGSAAVSINPLPSVYNVTGGGDYCAGGSGVSIALDGSDAGVAYQLYNGISTVGSPMPGISGPLDFGLQTNAGTYSVVATNTTTSCVNNMTGSAIISIDPLPAPYLITGGGSYCSGDAGVSIGLSSSDAGVNYQLFNGTTAVGSPVTGTGLALDFGLQTAAGTYSITATNTGTSCSRNMIGSVVISVNPLPTAYNISGTGTYCSGGPGLHILLSGSASGVAYQLYNGATPVGIPLNGTGMTLDFGLQTAIGVYTIVATNIVTSCTSTMTGSVTISTTPLPVSYAVTGGGNFCMGGTGADIALSGSDIGINYQLYNGLSPVGAPLTGSGASLDFGSFTTAGNYSVVATNATTGCTSNMSGGATITINALPNIYNVTGGGSFCSMGAGVHVGLSGSNSGISYQLYNGTTPVGSPVTGFGGTLDFGLQTAPGAYSVVATNTTTTCTSNMFGSATIAVNAAPATFTVTGGGSFCAGGTGVHIGISGSATGVNYQLFKGVTAIGSPVTGTGGAIDFGLFTTGGTYAVVATDPSTTCNANMSGSTSVAINPLPAPHSVTGGGNYCDGGAGVHVGITGSGAGIEYQLYNGITAIGSPVGGTGSPIDFGLQTLAGTYTIKASTTMGCTKTMTGSANVVIDPLPTAYNMAGGGSFCAGSTGVHVGLSGSATGISYQLYNGFSPAGSPVAGTGGILDFGVQTAAGSYTAIALNTSSACSNNMAGSAAVSVTPLVTPLVNIATAADDSLCAGSMVTLTALPVNGGTSPSYQWTVNGVVAGTDASYSYIPSNGDLIKVTMLSSANCAVPVSNTATRSFTVLPNQFPSVAVTADPGTNICQGTSVTYTAIPGNGGDNPGYTWMKNGAITSTLPTFSYTPANGDIVYCVMSSNYRCRLANSGTSDHMMMQVVVPVVPSVTVTSAQGTSIATGQSLELSANTTNAGNAPVYQWLVNGVPVPGAVAANFISSSFADGDIVTCQVTSSDACAQQGSGAVTIHVHQVGVAQLTNNSSTLSLAPNPSKGIFTIRGTKNGGTFGPAVVEVTDMLGKVVHRENVKDNNGQINVTIELNGDIANGMYLVSVHSETVNQVFHIVVER